MQRFVFLEHTADIKFQAFGKTPEECFGNAALAINETECDLKSIAQKEKIEITAEAQSMEELLHKFLEEVLFKMETEEMLFSEFELKIDEKSNSLKGKLLGEKIGNQKHEFKTHVKAVTWNSFFLRREKSKWVVQVVCDT